MHFGDLFNMCIVILSSHIISRAECGAVRKKDENRLNVAQTRMIRWIRGNTRKYHVRNQVTQEDAKVGPMPNVNIPETEKIKLLWTHQVKKRRQPLNKKMMSMLVSEMALQHPGRYEKYEMTADKRGQR